MIQSRLLEFDSLRFCFFFFSLLLLSLGDGHSQSAIRYFLAAVSSKPDPRYFYQPVTILTAVPTNVLA